VKKARKRRAQNPAKPAPTKKAPRAALPELTERVWWIAAAVIFVVGAILRLYALALKPMHNDEGVNGFFMMNLLRDGVYRYDPANYHGPTLYYLDLVIVRINGFLFHGEGLSDTSVRLVAAIFGIAMVALVLWMRQLLGKREALVAAALIAISPGAVFYSRYFIHEIPFVFFALGGAVCGWLAWKRCDPRFMPIGAVSLAFLFASKETAIISALGLVVAVPTQLYWARMREGLPAPAWKGFGNRQRTIIYSVLAVVLFIGLNVVLYSSFFTNAKGVRDAFATFAVWFKTGVTYQFYPRYIYLTWMAREEWPLMLISVVGTAVAVWTKPRSFASFIGIWTIGLYAVYTYISYKEPWLAINFIIPAAISGGGGAVYLWERSRERKLLWGLVCAGLTLVLFYETIHLNFVRYDDPDEAYVYMHSTREINFLVDEVNAYDARTHAGPEMEICITAGEYWPLPWYFRDYKKALFWGSVVPTTAPVVIGGKDQVPALTAELGLAYQLIRYYDLRPGVPLALFIRK
jgi:uncharacterized protein (TIGR03663 family)